MLFFGKQLSFYFKSGFNVIQDVSQNKGSPEKCAVKTPSHEENQPRKRLDPSAQEDLQEKMWDVGERGFLPAMDPVKDLPSPWDELVIIMDYVPSFSVQGHGGMGVWFFFQGLKKPAPLHSFRFSKRKTTRYF